MRKVKKTLKNKEKTVVFIKQMETSKTSEIAEMLGLSAARTRAMTDEGRLKTIGIKNIGK